MCFGPSVAGVLFLAVNILAGTALRSARFDLTENKLRYAHEAEFAPDLHAAVRAIRPHALVGVAGALAGVNVAEDAAAAGAGGAVPAVTSATPTASQSPAPLKL